MIDTDSRIYVRTRAQYCCEYCRVQDRALPVSGFHVEHIIPKQHHGSDDLSNLALACFHCNQHKGPNLAGVDPQNGEIVVLFNPRTQFWDEHFAWLGDDIVGLSSTGRATIDVLAMNSDLQRELRAALR